MKKNLFLAVAIAVSALAFFSCQDPIKDLTVKPGSAPEVAADLIKVETIGSSILVSWPVSENYGGYTVWRRQLNNNTDKEPVDGTAVSLGAGLSTTNKKLPYYVDTTAKEGEIYQYGVVSQTYKNGNADILEISDIVWQDAGEGAYVTAPAKQTTKKVIKNPAKDPVVTLTPLTYITDSTEAQPSTTNGGKVSATDKESRVPDEFLVELSGSDLDYNYGYTFQLQLSSDSTSANPGWATVANAITWTGPYLDGNNQPSISAAYIDSKLENFTPVWKGTISTANGGFGLWSLNSPNTGRYHVKTDADTRVKAIRVRVTYSAADTSSNVLEYTINGPADQAKGLQTTAQKVVTAKDIAF